ncbi:MAG: protein adenylyltransferase Fic [Sphaerochaetaceae bacterium]
MKILAPDGKQRSSDVLDDKDVLELATQFPNQRSSRFIQWFIHGEDTVDGKSKAKAYSLFGSSMIDSIEVGTVKGLQQIHSFIFGGLLDFAGQIRTKNISKGNFMFAPAKYLDNALKTIEKMPEQTFEQIIGKYVEMNVAHPFMEGNGRATRIWLDLILKRNLRFCVDWSLINKADYLDAMKLSPDDSSKIRNLIKNAMTNKIDDRQVYMKGIDYSYYYESDDDSFSSEAPCNPK